MLTSSTSPPATPANSGGSRSVTLGRVDLLLALVCTLVLGAGYRLTLLPEALAVLVLTAPAVAVASRIWRARRGQLEPGFRRHPFRREMTPFLLQCLNHWLFWALCGATILVGTFAVVPAQVQSLVSLPLPDRVPYLPLLVLLGLAALTMAMLALVPRRPVPVASNVAMAIGSVLLAVQLGQITTPAADPVAVHPPLTGEWETVAGGRSVLVSHHHTVPSVADAVDFVRIVHGHGHDGHPQRAESWYGFGEPVLAPADGTVVSVSDVHPDEPIGQTGETPPHGNHIVLALGPRRYAVLAHLQQGSARVTAGQLVRHGQPIAAVGDSGNSLWPHLHFHVQDAPNLDNSVRTVPVTFRDVVLVRNGRESTPAAADLRRGDRIRRIEG